MIFIGYVYKFMSKFINEFFISIDESWYLLTISWLFLTFKDAFNKTFCKEKTLGVAKI